MLKKVGLGLAVVGALMFGVCTVNTVFVGSVMASHEEGSKVEIAQVPAVVKAAIEKETAGGAAKEIMKKRPKAKCFMQSSTQRMVWKKHSTLCTRFSMVGYMSST